MSDEPVVSYLLAIIPKKGGDRASGEETHSTEIS
jgi:hypothetical protein